MNNAGISHLKELEQESIFIIREVAASFEKSVILYSVGKDSSVMLRLITKAFYPAPPPFPLMHIDTSYKFPEMYTFRDKMAKELGMKLIVEGADETQASPHPLTTGMDQCCGQLKTGALLKAIKKHGFQAAFGGARRDEEKSRAKERIFSVRDAFGQWDPKLQKPELWNQYNTKL
ncbi:MAG: sulfate adenylyltransferase subunit CysD, partial [SAR324 cluster bacterium]|nr:sulfate adenylyltransferase subunit CysD [SAR324 cluster bacterium]